MSHEELVESMVREMLAEHAESDTKPVLAALYTGEQPDHVYLLEVAEGVADPGDCDWDTFEFIPPREWQVPKGGRLAFTFLSPTEFARASEQPDTPGGGLLARLRSQVRTGQCKILLGAERPEARVLGA